MGLKAKSAACPYTPRGTRNHTVQSVEEMRFCFLTTEYTETVEPYLKNTERSSVYSVWERSDLSVNSVVKTAAVRKHWIDRVERVERVEINSEPNKRLRLTSPLLRDGKAYYSGPKMHRR